MMSNTLTTEQKEKQRPESEEKSCPKTSGRKSLTSMLQLKVMRPSPSSSTVLWLQLHMQFTTLWPFTGVVTNNSRNILWVINIVPMLWQLRKAALCQNAALEKLPIYYCKVLLIDTKLLFLAFMVNWNCINRNSKRVRSFRIRVSKDNNFNSKTKAHQCQMSPSTAEWAQRFGRRPKRKLLLKANHMNNYHNALWQTTKLLG